MKKRLLLSISMLFSLLTFAQNFPQHRNCGTMDNLTMLKNEDPGLEARMQQIESQTNTFINRKQNQNTTNTVITIPVVFHIVYNTNAQNISDAKCIAQLNQLNLDYARLNTDASNTPSAWQGISVNTTIQFCLAQRDPSGNLTTGIERRQTTTSTFSTNNNVKHQNTGGMDAWPSSSYLNIWSCNIGNGILGYAQFPGGSASTDGVVLLYSSIGSMLSPGPSNAAPFNIGRTATHEVGHWLNLYHIWGDESACSGSDNVGDTPNQGPENYGCPSFPLTDNCTSSSPGVMFMNYMDYVDDNCMNMFTNGQSTRMKALFAAGGSRVSILNSLGCVPPSATCDVPTGLTATLITTSGATLSWTPVPAATSYNIQYKVSTASTWTTTTSTTSTKVLTGLSSSTPYLFQVQSVCSSGTSNYSSSASFTTSTSVSCGTPVGLSVSSITTSGATLSWTAVSGAISYNIQYKTSTSANWNLTTSTTNSKNLIGLVSNTPYIWQVQAVCSSGSSGYSTTATFSTAAPASCGIPSGLNTTTITTTGATLNWVSVSGATSYNVQYKITGASNWTLTTSNTNSKVLSGLSSATPYQYQIQAVCTSGTSVYSSTATFTTATTSSCSDQFEPNNYTTQAALLPFNTNNSGLINTPTDLDWFKFTTISPNTNIKIVLSNLAADYDIRLYNSNYSLVAISQHYGTVSETIIHNSAISDTYYLRVYGFGGVYNASQCYNLRLDASNVSFRLADYDNPNEVSNEKENNILIYPNPVRDNMNVVFNSLANEKVTIRIFDLVGKTVQSSSQTTIEGDNKFDLDLSSLNNGIYFIELNGSNDRIVKRFIKEE